jgi:hypothetical protein
VSFDASQPYGPPQAGREIALPSAVAVTRQSCRIRLFIFSYILLRGGGRVVGVRGRELQKTPSCVRNCFGNHRLVGPASQLPSPEPGKTKERGIEVPCVIFLNS